MSDESFWSLLDVTWASCGLKSPVTRLFVEQVIQILITEISKSALTSLWCRLILPYYTHLSHFHPIDEAKLTILPKRCRTVTEPGCQFIFAKSVYPKLFSWLSSNLALFRVYEGVRTGEIQAALGDVNGRGWISVQWSQHFKLGYVWANPLLSRFSSVAIRPWEYEVCSS